MLLEVRWITKRTLNPHVRKILLSLVSLRVVAFRNRRGAVTECLAYLSDVHAAL